MQPQCPTVKALLVLSEQPGLCHHGCCCPAELMPCGAVSVPGSGLHQPHPSPAVGGEEVVRGIAVEKFDIVKKWGINTYKVSCFPGPSGWSGSLPGPPCSRLRRVGPAPALGAKEQWEVEDASGDLPAEFAGTAVLQLPATARSRSRWPGTWGLLMPSSLTLQCTKQLISERFGRGSRTVDLELETQIELLRETKRKYECVLQLARALTNHFYSLVQTQHALGDAFADLSQKSPELQVCPQGRWHLPCLCLCCSPLWLGRRPRDPNQPQALQHGWGQLSAPGA